MRKILYILFLIMSYHGFSQSIDLHYIDPKTRRPTNPHNFVDVDVTYNKPTKVTLKLLFKDYMKISDSYNWEIVDRNNGTIGNVNFAQIANSSGMINFHTSKSRDITFTIESTKNQKSTRQLIFEFRGSGTEAKYTANYRLYINVNNLSDPNAPTNPNPNPIPLCSDNRTYIVKKQTYSNAIMDHSIPNAIYPSVVIRNSQISARWVTIKGESHIYPNTTISSKSCREGKSFQNLENNIFEPTIIDKKINNNQLTISPNPTSGQVQINSEVEINDWYVYDINAKIVSSGNNKYKNSLKISLDNLPAGIYYFKFLDSLGILHEKTIIKK